MGMAQSLPFMLDLAGCEGMIPNSCFSWRDCCLGLAASPCFPWDAEMPRAGAAEAAHTSPPPLLQREDTAAAAGAWEEGEDEKPALREVWGGSGGGSARSGHGTLLATHPPMFLALQEALRIPL